VYLPSVVGVKPQADIYTTLGIYAANAKEHGLKPTLYSG
jgi:hypothetical protein